MGNFRDVYEVSFLHQDEPLGRYVCKRYRKQKPPVCYMQDVICQMVAGYYVTKFNDAILTYPGTTKLRVQFLPAFHLQLLTSDGTLSDWINVEPYLHGTFNKLTNNWSYINNAIEDKFNAKDLATALSHFSYIESKGTLMIVDIQGWLPNDKSGIIYLTDPLFHTCGIDKFSMGDHREDGMNKFWKNVHKSCNSICKFLHLKRPESV
ncbi:hypothetical protein LOTGIDRAFT_184684 [Lottia gigantea]|uniref:Alpha-type protein kinase domain-containing protein n=1 Tax=Lottia gigantea TaxID=225164 RepID=V3ZPU0_LOTGI|nr:hypothetical protein LOTGIDRAFT_184684 [Lottia gigantea]ESO82881.1 hypothetical protein LOTGIDRAFT_184684 [Lottia gigantea]